MSPSREPRVDQVSLLSEGEVNTPASNLFKRAWWAMALRGVAAIVLGIVMLTYPLTLSTFISILGGYLFIDGAVTLVAMAQAAQRGRSWGPYWSRGSSASDRHLRAHATFPALLLLVILLAVRALVVGGDRDRHRLLDPPVHRPLALAALAEPAPASLVFGLILFGRPGAGAAGAGLDRWPLRHHLRCHARRRGIPIERLQHPQGW